MTRKYFSNAVHYFRSSMPTSLKHNFIQSPSFQQVQSALIGQLTQCIVIGRTPQAHVGLWNQLSVINLISSSPRGEQSHVTDTVMMIVCVCKQATIKTISDGLYTPLWCDQSRSSLYTEYASCVRPPKHQGAPCSQRWIHFSFVLNLANGYESVNDNLL